jgi:glycosyltransferase involved in cell wall biosynthesis
MAPRAAGSRRRVAIDGTPFLGQRTGIGHLTAHLVDGLAQAGDVEVCVYAISRTGRRDLAPLVPPGVRIGGAPLPARYVFPFWERGWGPRIERWTGSVDVVHATNYRPPPARAPVLASIHDMTFVRHPELVDEETRRFGTRLVELAVERGASVHVISDFVGREVRDYYGLAPERVMRVYPGVVDMAGGDAAAGRHHAGAAEYVLALGQIEPRKNFPRLVQAFDRMAGAHPDLALVFAGPDGWDQPAFEGARAEARHRERVHHLGYVSDDVRRDLLAGARAFAYPSLYEGFGLPPLEAMSAGVPVVAGSGGSLPEVVGDAALLVEPEDVDAIADALLTLVGNDEVRRRLVETGAARAAGYTWERAAAELTDVYRRLSGA